MKTRERAVKEGRTFIEVRDGATGRLVTVGVCPGCWNSTIHRPALLAQLTERGHLVVHGDDSATGRFPADAPHIPGCPRAALRGE